MLLGCYGISMIKPASQLQIQKRKLQHCLAKMVAEARERAELQNQLLHQQGLVGRGWMYTKEYLEGLYGAGESAVAGMVKIVGEGGKLCGELMWDVISARISDLKQKLYQTKHIFKLAEQDINVIHLLLSDHDVRTALIDFVKQYFAVESNLELTHMAGAISFNILLFLLTAAGGKIMDAATAGFVAEASDTAIDAADAVRVTDVVGDMTDVATDMRSLDVQGLLASRYVREVIAILQDIAKELEHIHKLETLAEKTDQFLQSNAKDK